MRFNTHRMNTGTWYPREDGVVGGGKWIKTCGKWPGSSVSVELQPCHTGGEAAQQRNAPSKWQRITTARCDRRRKQLPNSAEWDCYALVMVMADAENACAGNAAVIASGKVSHSHRC